MKTNQVKNQWMNAGRIIAVLVLAMAMYGCPAIDDGNGDDGKKRVLNEDEKELVGKYSYGSGGGGYWTYYSYNYDQWVGGWKYASGLWFKSDGTFEGFTFASGSSFERGGCLIKTTGNWRIPVTGTVRFSNMVDNIQFADGTKKIWRQSESPDWDPDDEYAFMEQDGKKGIKWHGDFYEKE